MGVCLRFNMSGELVQDRLPTLALHFWFVFGLRLKSLPYEDSVGGVGELNLDVPTVTARRPTSASLDSASLSWPRMGFTIAPYRRFIELGQIVRDGKPRGLDVDIDVLVGSQPRIIVKETCGNFEPG